MSKYNVKIGKVLQKEAPSPQSKPSHFPGASMFCLEASYKALIRLKPYFK